MGVRRAFDKINLPLGKGRSVEEGLEMVIHVRKISVFYLYTSGVCFEHLQLHVVMHICMCTCTPMTGNADNSCGVNSNMQCIALQHCIPLF